MTENPSLSRSLSLLARPASLAAAAALFLNDHFLRVFFPSWITGKLGDLAWLYLSPLALAAALSLALPGTSRRRPQLPFWISLGLVAGTFSAANLSPALAGWLADWAGALLGLPLRITSDPTDLAALVSCGLAAWSWVRTRPAPRPSYAQGIILASLCAALTLANSMQPDYGIICLEAQPDRLVAGSSWFAYYTSSDGGETWGEGGEEDRISCDPFEVWTGELPVPGSEREIVRSLAQGQLEESRDGGSTWQPVTSPRRFSQAEAAWVQRTSRMFYRPGPLDAAADPETGSLVFAMGLEGLLVRSREGVWTNVALGEYGPVRLTPAMIPWLLQNELALAGAFAALLVLTPGVFRGKSVFIKIWLGLTWAAWLFCLLVLQPARLSGYGTVAGTVGVGFTGGSALILLAIYLTQNWAARKPGLGRALASALGGALGVLLPLVLWAVNAIPGYTWAAGLAALFGAAALAGYTRMGQE